MATLVLGILGIVLFPPLAIVAWVMGSRVRRELREKPGIYSPSQTGIAGRILGIIGTCLFGLEILVTVGILIFAIFIVQTTVGTPATTQTTTAHSVYAPPNANSDNTGIIVNPSKAGASAPVVAVYLDYQCPICHQLEDLYGSQFEKLADAGTIQLQYRTMAFLDINLHNDASTRAAVGAACADIAGVYSAYHDQIFANQPETEGAGYSDQLLRETIPTAIGLTGGNLTTFQQCYDTQVTKGFVQTVNDQALASGVTGTPTVKVNEKDLDLGKLSDPADLAAVIAQTAAS